MNFSWRSISAARWRWGFPFFAFSMLFSHHFWVGLTPTQRLKNRFSVFSFQEIGWSLVSFQMILEALQSELFRFKIYLLSSKILKIPELNLFMSERMLQKYENVFLVLTLVKFLALERLPQKQLNDGYLPTMRLY